MIEPLNFLKYGVLCYVIAGLGSNIVKYNSISFFGEWIVLSLMAQTPKGNKAYSTISSPVFVRWLKLLLRLQIFVFWPSLILKDYRAEAFRLVVKIDQDEEIFFITKDKE